MGDGRRMRNHGELRPPPNPPDGARSYRVWAVLVAVLLSAVGSCRTLSDSGGAQSSGERTQSGGSPYDDCASERIEEVVRFANRTRADRGVGSLHCAPKLSKVAERHARDMCDNEYLSHRGRDGSTPADRAEAVGVEANALGENIARGQKTAKYVHRGWMESRRHRKNIVRPVFSRIGVGYVECGDRPIWVTVFAN